MSRRRLLDRFLGTICAGSAATCCALLLGILSVITWRGLGAVDWEFLTTATRSGGAAGGVLYQILGTLVLVLTALLVCAPLSLSLGLLHSVYLRDHALRRPLSLTLYLLNGVPSILFGIIGMIVFVRYLDWGKSWLAGGVLLALMMLPTATIAFIEKIARVPQSQLEAASGLGLRRSAQIRTVIVPQSVGGLLTGLLLALARAVGETAPIMFTATIFSGATLPAGVRDSPVLSLPYHIFILAQDSASPDTRSRIWATALVLLSLVVLWSLLSLPARLRLHEPSAHR